MSMEQKIEEIMTRDVTTIAANALVEDALKIMVQKKVSGLPVLDEEERLCGVVTEYDVLEMLLRNDDDFWPIEPVADYVSHEVLTVEPTATLTEVAELFLNESVRRAPVVEDGKVVGVISRRDLVRAVLRERQSRMNEFFPEAVES